MSGAVFNPKKEIMYKNTVHFGTSQIFILHNMKQTNKKKRRHQKRAKKGKEI
jgi:hypothetical protein